MHAIFLARLLSLCCLSFLACAAEQHPLGAVEATTRTPNAADSNPSYRDTLLSLHRSLVEIPSITGDENKVGSFLVEYLTERGYVAQLQFLPPSENTPNGAERFNVVAWPGPTRNPQPRVLLTSHMDVVPPYIPYNMTPESAVGPDSIISGRGSVDAKGSVAAQITAMDILLAGNFVRPGDVMLLFVVGEETGGEGMRYFSDTLAQLDPPPRFDAAIFGEPTENRLACGHKGMLNCRLRAAGKAAHSGYPWLGKSANEILMRALVRVLDADLGTSERFGNTTVNVGLLQGGVAGNVIPSEAHALVTIRVAAGNQSTGADVVQKAFEGILADVDADAFDLRCDYGYGPVMCDCEVEGFETMVANYGTDMPNLKCDATKYLYGPGSIHVAHGDNEALKVSDLETAVDGYKKLVLHALGPRRGGAF